ncbi:RNA polymerase sigma-70 factor [Maribacter sp. 2210JD10-5]|uniref:RNA polymerase sigma-70 factor n=1 Tax=Maribacter sp. 2210JD10-5 TaxID=3386272 RepID=UPI0039BCD786
MVILKGDEKRLIAGLRAGDTDAFSQVYTLYYSKLCKYIYSLSDNSGHSEDVVQDALMKLWSKRESLVITTSLNAYLYRAVHNTFMDRCRKEGRKNTMMDELRMQAILEMESFENSLTGHRLELLKRAIDSLPPKRKDIFILHKLKNYKYKEIAAMRNISERTVEGQIRKAMITLRDQMVKLRLENILPLLLLLSS